MACKAPLPTACLQHAARHVLSIVGTLFPPAKHTHNKHTHALYNQAPDGRYFLGDDRQKTAVESKRIKIAGEGYAHTQGMHVLCTRER